MQPDKAPVSNIWIINFHSATPETGMPGRHHYLARELVRLGHEVTVIAARAQHLLRADIVAQTLPADERIEGYRFIRIAVPRYAHAHDKRRMIAAAVFSMRLPGLRHRLGARPDTVLVSSPDLMSYLGAERLARACGAKLVFEVRDIWPLSLIEIGGVSPRHPFMRLLQWIEDRAYMRADKALSNLPGAVEHMVARGMERAKFTWVSNGVDLAEVEAPAPLDPHIAVQIPQAGLRIVYTGALGMANALGTLIESAALLKDLDDVHILLVGEGRMRGALEALCRGLGVTNVQFLGSIPKPQVHAVLRACDACYIGLTSDPLFRFGVSPNKLFDYMASGTPVLYAIDSGAFNPVAEHDAGIALPPEAPEALAGAIRQLHAMPEAERQRRGANGRRAVLEHYDYAKLAKRLETVLVGPQP
ncbi:glycosyltransferase family 4 protein [Roseovarius sp. LXJ103]|uniref:glycosyltransferase family 4 protein n=1 Tax=Roseovarius carneus TaxID=2853164 RepID=UPI000D60F46C|nr:glycosyltransferase family 4 protein [Roseovarius carneus]MBZ8117578.1 glycosyltransferase family 4 protein [Roseovarius carneus]PWE36631.1 glycosyltransferase WbuB [Pelagicola sp. LXJ1103]